MAIKGLITACVPIHIRGAFRSPSSSSSRVFISLKCDAPRSAARRPCLEAFEMTIGSCRRHNDLSILRRRSGSLPVSPHRWSFVKYFWRRRCYVEQTFERKRDLVVDMPCRETAMGRFWQRRGIPFFAPGPGCAHISSTCILYAFLRKFSVTSSTARLGTT